MTAHSMRGDREECLSRGMDDYIEKPVRLERLQEVLARWIGTTPVEIDIAPQALKIVVPQNAPSRLFQTVA